MDPDGAIPDDLKVRLDWPQGPAGADEAVSEPSAVPPARAGGGGDPAPAARRPEPSTDLAVVERGTNAQATLASIAARLDALTGAATSLRGLVSDRLTDLSNEAERARQSAAHQGEQERRSQQQALSDIEGSARATEQSLHELDRTVARIARRLDEVAATFTDDLQRAAHAIEVAAGDHRSTHEALEQLRRLVSEVADREPAAAPDLSPVTEGIAGLSGEVRSLAEGVDGLVRQPDLEPLAARLEELGAATEELLGRPAPVATDLGPVQRALEPLHEALDELQARPPVELDPVLDDLAALRQLIEALPATLAGSVSPAEAALAGLEDRLVALAAEVTAGPSAVVGAIGPVRADLRSLLEEVARLGAGLAEADAGATGDAVVQEGFERVLAAIAARPPAEVPSEVREVKRALEGLELVVTEQERSDGTRLEAVATRLERRIDEVGRSLQSALERSASGPDETTRAAVGRIERAVTQDRDDTTAKALAEMDQTLGRLAQAQAEDFERVIDAVEGRPDTPELGPVAEHIERAAARVEHAVEALGAAPVQPGGQAVLERLDALTAQVEGLRRRIALRGRPGPALDEPAIDALAQAVAARVAALVAPPANGAAGRREPSLDRRPTGADE